MSDRPSRTRAVFGLIMVLVAGLASAVTPPMRDPELSRALQAARVSKGLDRNALARILHTYKEAVRDYEEERKPIPQWVRLKLPHIFPDFFSSSMFPPTPRPECIKAGRLYWGWGQKVFAKHMGVTQATVRAWENEEHPSEPRPEHIVNMSQLIPSHILYPRTYPLWRYSLPVLSPLELGEPLPLAVETFASDRLYLLFLTQPHWNKNLRAARQSVPYTRPQFAAKIGVKPPTIESWERAVRTPSMEYVKLFFEHLPPNILYRQLVNQ